MKKMFLFTGVLVASLSARSQSTIADWTFETSQPSITGAAAGPYAPEIGAGSATGLHASAATVYSTPSGNGSPHSFSANTWAVGDYYQFQVSTLGVSTPIFLSYDQTGSATGPKTFQLEYSLDGTSFVNIGSTYTVLLSTWNATTPMAGFTYTPDLSSLSATLDNQATLYFRLADAATNSINNGNVATGGTDRIDNFIVSTPEPSTFALVATGVAGLFFLRRRNQ